MSILPLKQSDSRAINQPNLNISAYNQNEGSQVASIEVASQLYKGMQGMPEQNQPQQLNLESSLVSSVNTLHETTSSKSDIMAKAAQLISQLKSILMQSGLGKAKIRQLIADATTIIQNDIIKQINDALAQQAAQKAQQEEAKKHSGVFGFLKDLVSAVVDTVVTVVKFVVDVVTFNFDEAGKDLNKLSGGIQSLAKKVGDSIKKFEEAIKQGKSPGEIIQAGLEVISTVIISIVLAPIALLAGAGTHQEMNEKTGKMEEVAGSNFLNDVHQICEIVTDAISGLVELIGAGLVSIVDQKAGKSLLEAAKKSGEKILNNPQLKTLAEIAMVVVIISSAISGNFALTALMVGMFAMSKLTTEDKDGNEVSYISAAGSFIAEKLDIPKWAGDLIVTAVVTALTLGASLGASAARGAAAAGETAAAAGEAAAVTADAAAIATESAAAAGEAAAETAAQSSSKLGQLLSSAKNGLVASSPYVMEASMLLQQSDFSVDVVENIKDGNLKKALTGLINLITLVITAVAGVGMAGGMSATEGAAERSSSFFTKANISRAQTLGHKMMKGQALMESINAVGQATNQIKNALRDVRVAMLDSLQVINENTQRTNISDIAKDNKDQKAQAQLFDQVVASITEQIQKTGTALNEAMSA